MSKPPFFLAQLENFLSGKFPEEMPRNEVFCMMPWIHFHITQYGSVAPCCVAPWDKSSAFGDINAGTIESIWNGDAIKNFRLKLLHGEKDFRCERCHSLESAGAVSLRQTINSQYAKRYFGRVKATEKDGTLPQHKPVYLDIRFSNKCNFKCRICGPHSSSAWHDDAVQLGLTSPASDAETVSIKDSPDFLKQLQPWIPELEEVYFAGGEPLFIDEHYRLLDALLEAGRQDVLLRYSTNFSSLEYEKGKAIQYWKSFEKVIVIASLDDMGARAELHRKGQNWAKTLENLNRLKREVPHAHLMVSPTVSIWNIWTICGLHRFLCEQGYIEPDDFAPNVLEQPEYFSIKTLPAENKKMLCEKITEHVQWIRAQSSGHPVMREWVARTFENFCNVMNAEDKTALLPLLHDHILKTDRVRREDTFTIIPELGEIFKKA